MARPLLIWLGLALSLLAPPVQAQEGNASGSQDAWLDSLVGSWTMDGHVMGDSVQYDASAKWVLNHHFLELQMTDVDRPPEYAAHVYIGYDSTRHEYVAHWLDTAGAEPSRTLGRGRRQGNTVTFHFEYPDGPFRTAFERQADGTWRVRMRSKTDSNGWRSFANFEIHRRPEP